MTNINNDLWLSLHSGLSTQLWHSAPALWPYVLMVFEWWKSYTVSYSSLTYWGMERRSWSARGQRQWHTYSLSLPLSLLDTHIHTHSALGQQHRWVLGKQAAAGGGKDHKAGWLAKFHHLLWIAWDAHSTATMGHVSASHATTNLSACAHRCVLSCTRLDILGCGVLNPEANDSLGNI